MDIVLPYFSKVDHLLCFPVFEIHRAVTLSLQISEKLRQTITAT